MTLDRKEWAELNAAASAVKRQEAPVQVRTVEMSGVWDDLLAWLHEQVEAREEAAVQALNAFQRSGDYSYEALAKHKSLLDIRQAEMLLIQNIEAKVTAYHQIEQGGS